MWFTVGGLAFELPGLELDEDEEVDEEAVAEFLAELGIYEEFDLGSMKRLCDLSDGEYWPLTESF
jgi:hypothetical protein